MKFRVEHIIKNITLAGYEKLYFDEPFNIALCEAVKLRRGKASLEIHDGRLKRAVVVGPERELPGPIAKIVGADHVEYTEHVDYRMGSHHGTWHTVPSFMANKVESSGTFSFRDVPTGVMRIVEGEVNVKIFGLGSVIEKFIISDVEKSYGQAAAFTQDWILRTVPGA